MTTTLHTFQSEEDQKFEEIYLHWKLEPGEANFSDIDLLIERQKAYLHSRDQRLLEQFVRETKVEERHLYDDSSSMQDPAVANEDGFNEALSEVSAAQTAFISNK